MVRLLDAAVTVDFNVDDEPGCLALAALSAPTIADVLRDSVRLLEEVRGHYESDLARSGEEGKGSDTLDDIGALISTAVAAEEIADLAFVTRAEVRHSLAYLDAAIASQDPLRIVGRCDEAVRRLRRGMIPLENAIGEFEGVEPPIRVWWDLEISLRIRSLYTDLRRRVALAPAPADDDLSERFEAVVQDLAALRSAEIYRFLRIDDRIQMRALYRRIMAWLGAEAGERLVEGHYLWQEVVSFVQLLTGVNNRQELREHDLAVVVRACTELLGAGASPAVVSPRLREELAQAVGRDDELDRLILDPDGANPEEWAGVLLRVRASLDGLGGSAETTGPAVG